MTRHTFQTEMKLLFLGYSSLIFHDLYWIKTRSRNKKNKSEVHTYRIIEKLLKYFINCRHNKLLGKRQHLLLDLIPTAKGQISRYQSPSSGFSHLCNIRNKRKSSTFHKRARCRREKTTCVRSGGNEAHTNPWFDRWNEKPLPLIGAWEIKICWCLFVGREGVTIWKAPSKYFFLLLLGLLVKIWMKVQRNQMPLCFLAKCLFHPNDCSPRRRQQQSLH